MCPDHAHFQAKIDIDQSEVIENENEWKLHQSIALAPLSIEKIIPDDFIFRSIEAVLSEVGSFQAQVVTSLVVLTMSTKASHWFDQFHFKIN